MKTFFRYLFLSSIAAASLQACSLKEAEPVKYAAPEVEYTMPSDNISATVGQTVSFSAKVVAGDKVSVSWTVDGILVSSAQSFDHVFEKPGTFPVVFEARNGAGSVSHEYTVDVSDVLSISLSVGDSTSVQRLQLDVLKLAAIVEHGSDVSHEWRVDDVLLGEDAFFGSFVLSEPRTYRLSYRGSNAAGTFEKNFNVVAVERPLEISYSITDELISIMSGTVVNISATALFGGSGLQQKWFVDDVELSQTGDFSHYFGAAGDFVIRYEAVNAKGERAGRNWKVSVTKSGDLLDDFEAAAVGSWFNLGENQPGIHLVPNPLSGGINTSPQCLCDQVNGTGSTSGYFTLKGPEILAKKGMDISKYSGIRFKVYLGNNRYYPRIDFGGTKYPSITPPKFNNEWEVLEYRLPSGAKFNSSQNIVFRMLYNESGSNISGYDEAANNRTVYIDDIEFFE